MWWPAFVLSILNHEFLGGQGTDSGLPSYIFLPRFFPFLSFFHTNGTLNVSSLKTTISQLPLKPGGQWDVRECHWVGLQENDLKGANSARGRTGFVLTLLSSCFLENGHDGGCSHGHIAMSESEDGSHVLKMDKQGLPWWHSGWDSTCQRRRHGFEPWSRKIPHAAEQLSPCATTTEPAF